MKSKFDYEILEKHFTLPKVKYVHKKLPRKLKKKLNKFIVNEKDLNIKMWYLGWFINPDYNRFIIKEICKNPNSSKWKKNNLLEQEENF